MQGRGVEKNARRRAVLVYKIAKRFKRNPQIPPSYGGEHEPPLLEDPGSEMSGTRFDARGTI